MMMKQLSCQNPSSAFSLAADELWPLPISATPNPDAADKSNSTLTRQSSCCTPNSQLLHSSTLAHFNDANAKRIKASGEGAPREESDDSKAEAETNSQTGDQLQDTKPDQPKDYIHVRAIRGQATDSLSLAERTRREKISERMKILQDLVPGSNKVIGKAQVLDESINYIRSLQHQVEFLSMKLEAVNSRMNPGIEGFPSKDLASPPFDATEMIFGQQAPREYAQVAQHEWVHMQVRSKL